MKIAVMQPYFFPYLGYFQLINYVDKFIILDDVNFIKRGWINRNRILLNGKEHLLTLPLVNVSQNRVINSTFIEDISNWRTKYIKTIQLAYKKAPFFYPVFDLFRDCINYPCLNLSDYVTNSLKKVCAFLEIPTEINYSSVRYNSAGLKGKYKIFSICEQEKASNYINPVGGLNLYQKSEFNERKLQVQFLRMDQIKYKQYSNEFIPDLSILDVLFFNSKTKVKEFLQHFTLI